MNHISPNGFDLKKKKVSINSCMVTGLCISDGNADLRIVAINVNAKNGIPSLSVFAITTSL